MKIFVIKDTEFGKQKSEDRRQNIETEDRIRFAENLFCLDL